MASSDVWICPDCGTVFHSVYAFDLHVCDVDDRDDLDDQMKEQREQHR